MKFTKKKVIFLIIIILLASTTVIYYFSYPIELSETTLPEYIEDFFIHGNGAEQPPDILLYNGISLGSKEYYLIEIGEDLGYVSLEKGLFGRYKINCIGYGGGNFREGIVESDGKKYLLFAGRDISAQISRITVSINGVNYDLFTQDSQEHFLVYTEVDYRIEDTHVSRDDIIFYNESGENITELYDLSGGGIQ